MKTKHTDNIIETDDLQEIKGKFLAKRLLRSWNEDYVDEDSGEVVTIKRNEIIFDKGELIDDQVLSQINFFLTSGDIEKVKVSEIQRTGTASKSINTVYSVTVLNGKKKSTFLLYANSIETAIEIATDYLEQKLLGIFQFTSVKELNFITLIPTAKSREDQVLNDFYSVELQIFIDESLSFQSFVLRAEDAEDAKNTAEKDIISTLKKNDLYQEDVTVVETTLISAKKMNYEDVIDLNFSKPYLEEEN